MRYEQSSEDRLRDIESGSRITDHSHHGKRNRSKQRAWAARHAKPFAGALKWRAAKAWRTPRLPRYCVWRAIRADGTAIYLAGDEAGVGCGVWARKRMAQAVRLERVLSALTRNAAAAVAAMMRREAKSDPQYAPNREPVVRDR